MLKKIIAIGIIAGGIYLAGFSIKTAPYTYYRGIDGTVNGLHYETVAGRCERCTYIGNNNYITDDGNIWNFSDGKKRSINHKYYITIEDNATPDYVKDDVVICIK